MQAFLHRFERAFPLDQFVWEKSERASKSVISRKMTSSIITGGMSVCFNETGGHTVFTIKSKEGNRIAVITVFTEFGSKIVVSSAHLPEKMNGFFMIYRRPLNLSFSTIYGRRHSLSRKVKKHPPQFPPPRPSIPNFKREGATLASAIKKNWKACCDKARASRK